MFNKRPQQPRWGVGPALAVRGRLHPPGKDPTVAPSWPDTEQTLSNRVLGGTRGWKCRVSLRNPQG